MWPLQKPAPSQGVSTGNGRRGCPAGRARCFQHLSTRWKVGQGLFAKLLGLIKRQIFFASDKNAEALPSCFPDLEGQGV